MNKYLLFGKEAVTFYYLKEAWWSRGSVPASGPHGLGSNLGPGPPHSVV